MSTVGRGYAEGFYGRLLTWPERLQILETLERSACDCYYYAPKEDALHRFRWRHPYDDDWRESFRTFCSEARERGISVVAGVAPGLDFDYRHLDRGSDFFALRDKCRQLLADGADRVSLLMDDIDADYLRRSAGIRLEGEAHARLANALGTSLGEALWVTPRVYANELAIDDAEYLPALMQHLSPEHAVLYCGTDIVSRQATAEDLYQCVSPTEHRLILWDNLYANDYCPRRLFVGAWTGRNNATSVLLNPTGMVHTDRLLIDIMHECSQSNDSHGVWTDTLMRHEVPSCFLSIAPYFYHPVFNGAHQGSHPVSSPDTMAAGSLRPLPDPDAKVFSAIETCLWQWKTPLSREWYPAIFGLKHDLMISQGTLSEQRIDKTQNAPLAAHLR